LAASAALDWESPMDLKRGISGSVVDEVSDDTLLAGFGAIDVEDDNVQA